MDRSTRKKWLGRLVRLGIVVLVLWGIRSTLISGIRQLEGIEWHFEPLWLLLSAALYLAGQLPSGWFWYRLLGAMGGSPSLVRSLRAYYIGHLGKYVPGKALVVVLRAGLVRNERVDGVAAAVAVFYETLTTMAVGGMLAAVVLAAWFPGHWEWLLLAVGLAVLFGLPTLPPLARHAARMAGVGRARPEVLDRLAQMPPGTILEGWGAITLGWLVLGLSLWATLQAIGAGAASPWEALPQYTGSMALATVAGFASFVPGGFIVREGVLMELLAMGPSAEPMALVATVLTRLVALGGELLLSGVLFCFGRAREQDAG